MRVRRIFVCVDLGLEGLEFGFDLGFVAFGTDAVAECHVSAGFDIAFDLLPVILVVAYLFAVGADRQKPLQVLLTFDRPPRPALGPSAQSACRERVCLPTWVQACISLRSKGLLR